MGILLGAAPSRFSLIGVFEAEGIAKVLNGFPISSLSQELIDPISLSINLKTAELLNYTPPIKLMGVIEEMVR